MRARRSALYVPGANLRALGKAAGLGADVLILDLEDAVLPAAKDQARAQVVAALEGRFRAAEVVVRINGLDTPWGAADVAALAGTGVDALLVPKVCAAADLAAVAGRLEQAGGRDDIALWAMAETPQAVLAIHAICGARPGPEVIVMGMNDLAKALRMPGAAANTGLATARSLCVLGARAQGVDILDGVYGDLGDAQGFREVCAEGRMLGFDGKTLIHPGQIDTANELFGVSAAQAAEAAELVAAWEAALEQGHGVAVVRGRMIEALHAEEARRVLALHAATTAAANSD